MSNIAMCYVTYNGLCQIQRGGDETTPQPSLMSTLPHTYTTTHCHALQHTTTHYNTLQHTASHCNIHNTLQNAATRTNTLQHAQHTHHTFPPPLNTISMSISPLPHAYTVTHYNKLQHTTTHCNTLQHTVTVEKRNREDQLIHMQYTATHCQTLQQWKNRVRPRIEKSHCGRTRV